MQWLRQSLYGHVICFGWIFMIELDVLCTVTDSQ